MRPYFLLLLACLIFSCEKPEEETTIHSRNKNSYPGVSEDFWPHFQNFEEEAAERGLNIDLEGAGIIATFELIDTTNQIAGVCNYHPSRPGAIIIDQKFWQGTTDLAHELALFHELGHCALGRDHLDDAYSSGFCKSIMRSGTASCMDFYNEDTRALYLDELFQ